MIKQLLALVGLSMLPACPLLDVEVEVPEVCVSYHDLQVDGFIGPDGTTTVHKTFAVDDLSAFHQITDRDADVAFVRAELLALTGIDDFAFVEGAKITITSEGSDLPPLVLYACDGDCVPADGLLDMTASAQHDALEYLKGDALTVDVELTGRLPRAAWSMSVDVCFEASARYSY